MKTDLDTKLAEIQARVDKVDSLTGTGIAKAFFQMARHDLPFCLQTIAELREDRERLDWLQQLELNRMIDAKLIGPNGEKDFLVLAEDQTTCWGKTYRQAIDAARGKENV